MRRTARGLIDASHVLPLLKTGRQRAIEVCRKARIGSPEYRAAEWALLAIDTLAEQLTGDRCFFHESGDTTKHPRTRD